MSTFLREFHRLWSERVHEPGYAKAPWMTLCNAAEWADRRGDDALRFYLIETAGALGVSQGASTRVQNQGALWAYQPRASL